jgi:purine-nucleoside phosphorylase
MSLHESLDALVAQIRTQCHFVPKVGILLGTGLGGLGERIQAEARIPYASLEGMPRPTADSHKGEIILGRLGDVQVVAFSGRLHAYEGHSLQDVVTPVRLIRRLGAETMIMGSAVGGLDPRHQVGDLVVLHDHINLMGVNPLVGPNDDRVGPRWPDMIEPYSHKLRKLAIEVALEQHVTLHEAVYAAVLGPNLETRAEYRMLRTLGADVVGMSTVPEAIAAVHCGLRTLSFAVVTDRCLPDALGPANIQQIISAANDAEPVLTQIITAVLPRL